MLLSWATEPTESGAAEAAVAKSAVAPTAREMASLFIFFSKGDVSESQQTDDRMVPDTPLRILPQVIWLN
jgi:hypothetical protein